MSGRRMLVALSTAQLAAGTAGQVVAIRERRAFDIAGIGWRGRPERVGRDSWLLGTGLSAPVFMLVAQAAATVRLAAGPSCRATRTLGMLGSAMIGGYLVEREFRTAMTPGSFNPVVTPVAGVAFGSAVPMAVLGLRGADCQH